MLANNLITTWQRMLASRGSGPGPLADGRAAIHRYDPIDDYSAWARCRERARFHLGRARRAKDHGRFLEAAREIERALQYDDTSEAYFQVLGQSHLLASPPDLPAARRALERALSIDPRNGYTIKLLLQVYEADGNFVAACCTIERALAAGAPNGVWAGTLDHYRDLRTAAAVA
jgi:tetratricopeptide (TPR) repeat protein